MLLAKIYFYLQQLAYNLTGFTNLMLSSIEESYDTFFLIPSFFLDAKNKLEWINLFLFYSLFVFEDKTRKLELNPHPKEWAANV